MFWQGNCRSVRCIVLFACGRIEGNASVKHHLVHRALLLIVPAVLVASQTEGFAAPFPGPDHSVDGPSRLRPLWHAPSQRFSKPIASICSWVRSSACTARRTLRKITYKARALGCLLRQNLTTKNIGHACKTAVRWVKTHPREAIGISAGAVAMLGTAFYAAPALSAAVAAWLTPTIGTTAATVVGTATGGAMACGARSLLVHTTPMALRVDPFNARQLSTDVAMSSTFGFFGFAQAALIKTLTGMTGASGLGLMATNAVGLVGYEMLKDYMQNRIRNPVANDPKPFSKIWHKSLLMETASNLHRCIPGLNLETNYMAKVLGDLGGTIWWDRIINKRNPGKRAGQDLDHSIRAAHQALTE